MVEETGSLSFGALAIQLGFTTADRINEALVIQHKIKELGVQPKRLGEIMIDKGYLTEAQVKHIFRVQGLKGGHIQIEGYQILRKIGEGAMGTVYQARQTSMDRLVAVKVLSPQLAQNERFVERFFREARFVAKLNHPNIIQGIDVGESNGIHYFAMEYIDGPTLEEMVKKNGPIKEKEALEIIIQVARALDHAHKNNLIHRDIKPSNIMINRSKVAKLCDLGLARIILPGQTAEGRAVLGTPSYISPEQARAEPDVDIRSDIYSLGATFYFVITGEVPFPAKTASEAMAKHLSQEPIPPRQKNPQISNLVEAIVLKMLAKKRELRYQSPEELVTQLEMAHYQLAREETSAPEPRPLHQTLPVTSRRGAWRHAPMSRPAGVRGRLRFLHTKRWFKR